MFYISYHYYIQIIIIYNYIQIHYCQKILDKLENEQDEEYDKNDDNNPSNTASLYSSLEP